MKIITWDNQAVDIALPENLTGNFLALPALVDPHVHFRTPGAEHKENWISGAEAAIAGGVTTVFDMPNNIPSTENTKTLKHKKHLIDEQLAEVNIPLHYYLYLGATPNNLNEIKEIKKLRNYVVGVKMFMGASTGNLLVDKIEDQEKIFKACAENDLILAVHAEDELEIGNWKLEIGATNDIKEHSNIRNRKAAIIAVTNAINLAQKYGTKLYICHVSTKEEVELIKSAKLSGVKVYAEATPHHLFLSENDYERLGTLGQMNPPLRTALDQKALWQGILDGTIDTIGTDHAPHTLEEKAKIYPNSPSGVPGIETTLPLLLNEYNLGKISLEKIVELTRTNAQKIFGLPKNNDWVIVDLDLEKEVKNENLKTKCGWSPFNSTTLRGWSIATIIQNKIYII